MAATLVSVSYLGATMLFILSLGGLSHPETSRRGNLYGIIGMIIAVLATVAGPNVTAGGYPWIIGAMVVGNVTPALHTPLMSVTNAISSIIAIGALVQVAPPLAAAAGADRPEAWILGLAVVAVALTSINMFGGFAVTQRMLQMFRK